MGYLLVFLLPTLVTLAFALGGVWVLIPFGLIFFVHPLLDQIKIPVRSTRPSELESRISETVLLAYVLIQTAVLFFAYSQIYSMDLSTGRAIFLGGLLSTMTGAIGITAAHELIHRPVKWQRGLGLFLLVQVLYMHFRIEHVFGHHVWVGTERDPATARKNESLYRFWIRTIPAQFRDAWRLESMRKWYRNRVAQYLLIQFALVSLIFIGFGFYFGVVFLSQALFSILYLETVNYLEHYGLVRLKTGDNKWQPITDKVSWDCEYLLTNRILFNLGIHNDHHLHPRRKYSELRLSKESLKMPFGYSTGLLLSLIPPFWFRIMNKKLEFQIV